MKKNSYISLALLLTSTLLMAEKPSTLEIENNYTKVIVMDKGVKRTLLIPKDDALKNKVNPMQAAQAASKDGVIICFKDPSAVSIDAFEAKYKLKLQHKLKIGYYIFANVSKLSDVQIVEAIITNETNVETVKPNWKMSNVIR